MTRAGLSYLYLRMSSSGAPVRVYTMPQSPNSIITFQNYTQSYQKADKAVSDRGGTVPGMHGVLAS